MTNGAIYLNAAYAGPYADDERVDLARFGGGGLRLRGQEFLAAK
jgi:hypothetical protein